MKFQTTIPGFFINVELDIENPDDRSLLAKCFLKANREMKREVRSYDEKKS